MIELFKPDMYMKDIYSINYNKIKSFGIKCILFDLDNTLVPSFKNKPTRKVKDLIEKLKDMGFKVIIFSNSNKKRLTPFKNILEVDCSYSSKKPLRYREYFDSAQEIQEQDFDNAPHILFPYLQADSLIDLQSTSRLPCSDMYLNKKLLRS